MAYEQFSSIDSVGAFLEYKVQCLQDGSIIPKQQIYEDIDALLDRHNQIRTDHEYYEITRRMGDLTMLSDDVVVLYDR